jgi:hypothetical protein
MEKLTPRYMASWPLPKCMEAPRRNVGYHHVCDFLDSRSAYTVSFFCLYAGFLKMTICRLTLGQFEKIQNFFMSVVVFKK